MKKYILFDMDGVLVNTEPLHYEIWKQIMKENGVDIDYETYKPCIGSTRAFLYDLMKNEYGIDMKKNENIPKRFSEIKKERITRDGVPEIKGVRETVRYLYEKGYHLAVASSSPQKFIDYHISELGLTECFEILFSAEKVKKSKPAPDVFLAVADKLGAKTNECLVIEDSYNGSRAAKAAEMTCYGFKNPDSGNQDLSCADKIIYSFSELKKLL